MTAFVFEGPDRVGKSTLLQKVQDLTGWEKVWVERPGEGWEVTQEWVQGKTDLEQLTAKFRNSREHFVMDRFSYSEVVYSRVFNNRPCDVGWYMEKLQENRDVLKLIICDEPWHVLSERWVREAMPVENIVRIQQAYSLLPAELSLLEGHDYIRVRPSDPQQVQKAVDWIHDQASLRPSD